MPNYRTMICAHGVLATIAFLGLVPASVLIIRYYSRWNPYWAFKLHVWCQVLTLFMSTIVFVLGWFAVGPERSLSNPHHGIGLAIYVLVIFQVMWGYLVHRIERNKKRYHVPFKLVVSACPYAVMFFLLILRTRSIVGLAVFLLSWVSSKYHWVSPYTVRRKCSSSCSQSQSSRFSSHSLCCPTYTIPKVIQ